jgi:hypothetical protein
MWRHGGGTVEAWRSTVEMEVRRHGVMVRGDGGLGMTAWALETNHTIRAVGH